eukprot:scaffold2226_cov383-Chaetoceros_neogracile.AAC.2
MGWETKILTEKDAIKHLHMLKLLNETFKNNRAVPYNHRCYWRWLAVPMNEDVHSSWMSDRVTVKWG